MSNEVKAVEQPKTEIAVPVVFAQELLNYLQSRPYAEVYGLIGKLMELAKSQGVK